MKLTLGDGFNRRKKLAADLQTWINRLHTSGTNGRAFRTKAIEGEAAFVPEPGSEKVRERHYTIEECRARIAEILAEDRDLALRISLTNQRAKAEILDLDGHTRELSIPELLVLKADIIPKLEQAARAVPTRAEGVNVFDRGDGFVRHRSIKQLEQKKQTMSDKGMKIEETEIIGYDVAETTDYGILQRDAWNEVDRIQEFAQRVKQAINRANKAELVDL